MILKCKMCGGDIELSADKTYGTCDYCGSTMTFPKVDDDHRANLFNRANHFRRQNEFDKAVSAYERILNEDNTDAEAHWGVVLSRFGIEYVEDPVSHERIPTCHRVQVTSILTDADYLAALEYAPDNYSRDLYVAEAKRIADIQKGILAISAQEKPYDVFICYKESSEDGSRTKDSTIAQDIYYQLKQEGFNVFFARITLEDKLGQQYEPYIFAALNSAKVMLVVGTKPEYFNAVWVKNEWSRYLALMKQERSRLLIPCYRDMDAYELPDELSALQSQDMSKIGFMQDLIRGVRKVLGASQPQQPAPSTQAAAAAPVNTVAPLVKRIFMFLEDGDWTSADEYCEKVLDMDPENAQAYLGKLMAGLKVPTTKKLAYCPKPFDKNPHYLKVLRFCDDALKSELQACIAKINNRNEQAHLEELYQRASKTMQQAHTADAYKSAASEFDSVRNYKDAAAKVDRCLELAERARKDAIYETAKVQMNSDSVVGYTQAIRRLKEIPGWKDADALIPVCEQKIQELREKAEAERLEQKRRAEQLEMERKRLAEEEQKRQEAARKRNIRLGVVAVIVVVAILVVTMVIIPNQKYDAAMELMNTGKYEEAIAAFGEIMTHKDSTEQIKTCETAILDRKYDAAVALMNAGKYSEAIVAFGEIATHKDSKTQIKACELGILDNKYDAAVALMNAGKYEEAIAAFSKIKTHKDSAALITECQYGNAIELLNSGKCAEAYDVFIALGGYKDSTEKAIESWNRYKIPELRRAAVGSYVTFGTYEQDGNTANGKEEIEWLVLAKENDRLFVVSRYALDCKQYNTSRTSVTWETCTLRTWLNQDFFNAAFFSAEQAKIPTVMVAADKNPYDDTNPGNATQDQVFLLSYAEIKRYFSSSNAQCRATAYARKKGVDYSNKGWCLWWLRTPGMNQDCAFFYQDYGQHIGHKVDLTDAVRPALWIDISQ